jgi:DNA polymerase-3 subunit epsilon
MTQTQTAMNFNDKHPSSLHLSKPIVFLDLETTGVDIVKDRIIEIALVKIKANGEKEVKRKLINPEMPIPAQATAVHGISDEMVANAPTFRQAVNEIVQFIKGCDLAGYNSNRFDIPMLAEEILRTGIEWDMDNVKMLDVQKIFHMMEQRTLSAAYKFYCNKELEGAHSAEVDATATWEVLLSQLVKYPQLGNTIDSVLKVIGEEKVVDYSRRFIFENDVEVFNFGKHKGKLVEEVLRTEPQYYDWMMKGDFSLHTKLKLTEILNRSLLKKRFSK